MRILSLLFLCSSLFANSSAKPFTYELLNSAPTEIATPKVDIMTGTYVEEALDLVIAACEPLSIRRFYYHTAPTGDTRYGFWHFNPEANLTANFEYGALPRFASVGQFTGGMLQLNQSQASSFCLNNNTQTGYGGQNHPLNTKVTYSKRGDRDNKERFMWVGQVVDGSGSCRTFSSAMHHWHKDNTREAFHPSIWIPYHLQVEEEKQPNGLVLAYEYCNWRREKAFPSPKLLKKITLYNATKTKEIASCSFIYKAYDWDLSVEQGLDKKSRKLCGGKEIDEVAQFTIAGSDGRTATYHNTRRKRSYDPVVLHSVQTPTDSYKLNYDGFRLKSLQKQNVSFQTEYDQEGRVKAQYSAAGLVAKYHYSSGMTEVTNGEGHTTRYFFDTRINRIEHEDHSEENSWDPDTGNLLCYTVKDKQGNVCFKKTLVYDKNHNPIEERVDDHVIYRTFSDDGFNLKLSESTKEGSFTRYSYLPNTNLLTAELFYEGDTLRKRVFHTYDDCAICIRTIVDDGSTADPANLKDVTYRKITEVTPKYSQPCFGLPEIIEEKTINNAGEEILLKKVAYTYATSGKILTEKHYDAEGIYRYTINYTYDDKERLTSTTDPLGHTTTLAYDVHGNLVSIIGPRKDQTQTISYDEANRPIHINNSGQITQKTYNTLNQITSETDPYGGTTYFTYDAAGRIQATTYPDGGIEKREYDALGNLIKTTDTMGYETHITYNQRKQPLTICYADGSEERFSYNPSGTKASHTDKNGTTSFYTYDIFDHLIETRTEDKITSAKWSAFCKLSETDGEGLTTFHSYDFAGRKTAEQKASKKTSYTYDALGHLNIIDEGEFQTILTHDKAGRLLSKSIPGQFQESYAYDEMGNRTKLITAHGTAETLYDPLGRKLQEKDPLGHITTYSYCDFDRIETLTDANGIQIVRTFDPCHREIEICTKNKNNAIIARTQNAYDKRGLLTKSTHFVFDGTTFLHTITHLWSYGPEKRLELFLEAGEKETLYTYDNKGRLQTTHKPSGIKLNYAWDNQGRLSHYFSTDFDYHYTYDRNDRLISVYDTITQQKTTRSYDELGNIIQESLANGLTLLNTYDHLGRRIALTLPDHSTINYTHKGPYLCKLERNGSIYSYTARDLSGLLTQIDLPSNLGKISIKRDALGRLKTFDAPFYKASFSEKAYDPVGNLLSYDYHDSLGDANCTYTYDDLNQLTSEKEHTYTFDSLNNRTSKDQIPHQNNILCQITHDGNTAYEYDLDGNLIFDGQWRYSYDTQDRLITAANTTTQIHFTYDPFHRRLSKRVIKQNVTDHHYIWDGDNEIGTANPDGTLEELRVLGEGLGAEIGAAALYELHGKTYFPIHDHRGCVVTLIDPAHITQETYRYTAFGEELTDSTLSPWRFSSKRIDPETGLIFFGRRYYNPTLGRWISQDPEGFNDGPNLYAYVHNHPLTAWDLEGLFERDCARPGRITLESLWLERLSHSTELTDRLFPIEPREFSLNDFYSEQYKLHSKLRFCYGNGINTNFAGAVDDAKHLARLTGGYNVAGLNNPTHGTKADIFRCALETTFQLTPKNIRCRVDFLREQIASLPQEGKVVSIIHSEGAIVERYALQRLSAEERNKIHVIAVCPGMLIEKNLALSVVNIQNRKATRDVVPRTTYFLRKSRSHYNIINVDSHPNAPKFDHSFQSQTYEKTIEDQIQEIFEVYN